MSLSGFVFISYTPEDGAHAALRIADQLRISVPPVPCWIPELNVTDTDSPVEEVTSAIQRCSCFLLVLTKAASEHGSRAADEWKLALRYKKAIIIAAVDKCELPPRLTRRSRVAIDPAAGRTFEALREAILRTATTEGLLATSQYYLEDAEQAKRYAPPDRIPRIDADIAELKRLVKSLSEALSDPVGVRDRLNQRIRIGVERERIPHSIPDVDERVIFINAPPVVAPGHFQDRFLETRIICDFVRDETKRLLLVTGRGGASGSRH